jgi:hypothetical protein
MLPAVHVVLLWLAVFVGLDLAVGDGVLTAELEATIEWAVKRLRDLLRRG